MRTQLRPVGSIFLLLINLFRVENALANNDIIIPFEFAEEATRIPFVASRAAYLINFKQQRVAIAIDINLMNFLHVAALFAFTPQFLTTPTIVHSVAEF